MDGSFILFLGRRTLETALLVSAPVLIVAVLIGFGAAILQAVTSVRDMTLSMVLKIVGVGLALLVFGAWMVQVSVGFTVEVFNHMATMSP